MNKDLPNNNKLIPIGEAADFLGVSIDTVRRWDKQGIIHSTRPDGKNRFFSLDELSGIKLAKPLSISEASEKLGISQSTLRRIEKKGLLTPERDANGERVYKKEDIEKFINSEYFLRKSAIQDEILEPFQATESVLIPDKKEVSDHQVTTHKVMGGAIEDIKGNVRGLEAFKNAFYTSGLMVVTAVIFLVSFITIMFFAYPEATGQYFGFRRISVNGKETSRGKVVTNVLGAVADEEKGEVSSIILSATLKPFSQISLGIVKAISPETYRKAVPVDQISNISDVFVKNEGGNLELVHSLTIDGNDIQVRNSSGDTQSLDSYLTNESIETGVVNTSTLSEVTSEMIVDETITGVDIANGGIGSADLADGSVTSSKLSSDAITGSGIKDDTITTSDLISRLTFGDGDFIDLSAVLHNDAGLQGLRLPNVASATPTNPESGEGFLAYDTAGNQVIYFDGSNWVPVGTTSTGTIEGVTAGNGITGGGTSGTVSVAINLTTSGTTGSSTSNSGLEVGSGGLTLLKGCADGELLKWNETNDVWECSTDNGGVGGGGIATIQENNGTIVSNATTIDFLGSDFTVTADGSTEGDISIDYTNSKIVRSDQNESISGAWGFSNLTISDTNIPLTGGSVTMDFNSSSDRTLTVTNSDSGVAGLSVEGAISAGAGLTVSTGSVSLPTGSVANAALANSSITISNGTGISGGAAVSLGGTVTLATTLGTSIANSEIDNDTIDFDKINDSLTLDGATTITAGSALGLTIGNNVTLATSGTGSITATDLSCTDCIGGTEISDLTIGTDTAGDYVATITAGDGLASTGATSGESIAHSLSVNTGNGLTTSSDAVVLGALTSDWTQSGAYDIVLSNASSELKIKESAGDAYYGILEVGDLSSADATYTFSGASGTVLTSTNAATTLSTWDQSSSDDLTTSTTFGGDVTGAYGSLAIGSGTIDDTELADTISYTGALTVSNLTISDTTVPLTGSSFALDFNNASDRTLNVTNSNDGVANLNVEGTITAGAGLTVSTGSVSLPTGSVANAALANSSITISNGTGISGGAAVSLGGTVTLATTLGTSIANSEIDNDTIDFDKINSSLTLDEQTTIAAGSALNLYVGNNVTLATTGTGAITATDLSCTNCIGATEIAELTLGDDTTGSYVATISSGNGISASATGEGSTPTIALAALTGDWTQSGAYDIVLSNASSELKIKESTGDQYYGILEVGDLSSADATYTFSGASGTVLTSTNAATTLSTWDQISSDDLTTGNYTSTLDSVYVNASESPTSADITGSFSTGLTVGSNAVALGDDTSGNFVAGATTNGGLSMTGTEAGTLGILLPTATNGISSTLNSGSGLELTSSGLSMLQGCGDGEVLKWNENNDYWYCAGDNAGAGAQTMQQTYEQGNTISITSGEGAFGITATSANLDITVGSGTDTGDFRIYDGSVNWMFIDESADTLALGAAAGSGITIGDTGITTTVNGTLAAGTVNIDGGNIDGTTIGASTPGAATLTTLNANGTVVLGDGTGDDSITIRKNGTGNVVFTGYTSCSALETDSSGNLACGTDDTGGGAASLDSSYNVGGSITVDAYDVLFSLNNATDDYKFTIDNATNGTISTAMAITTTGGASSVITTAIDLSDADIVTALALGSNDVTVNGSTISSAEFALLDGGIALSELTDSGTLTAGTVDLNGGNIDGVTIGASTAGAGTFTTLTATGDVTMNDATADNILIGQSGTTDDTVTIAGILSLTDDHWSITEAGAASLVSLTTTGDVAVNGDDITADGALTINSASYVRVGDTGTPGVANGDDDLYVEGDLEVDGVLYTDGGIDTVFTSGSIVFAGANGVLSQDNTKFFWDDSSDYLGIQDGSPTALLDIGGTVGTGIRKMNLYEDGSNGWSFEVRPSEFNMTLRGTSVPFYVKQKAIGDAASAAGTTLMMIEPGGNVGFGNSMTDAQATIDIRNNFPTPSGIQSNLTSVVEGKGDNATFIGVSGGYFQARDRSDVDANNKGVLYGLQASVYPTISRNNVPYDDVAAIVAQNDGTAKGTDAIYVGHNSGITGSEWVTGVLVDAYADTAFRAAGTYTNGLRLDEATISGSSILMANTKAIAADNAANDAVINIAAVNASNNVSLRDDSVVIDSSGNVGIGATTPGYKLDVSGTGNNRIRIANITGTGSAVKGVEVTSSRNDGNTTFEGRIAAGMRRSDGTAIASGSSLGALLFGGQWGTDTTFQSAKLLYPASIQGVSEGDFTAADAMPMGLSFRVGSTGNDFGSVNVSYGTEAMRILNTGYVGIGDSSPAALFTVGSGDKFQIDANGNVTTAGTMAVNGDSITADGATLTINAAGNVDVQDALNADSITSDAGVSIAAANSYTGAGAVTLSSASTGGSALSIVSGNNSGGAAGNVSIDVGTSSAGNGSILIGNAARAQTITIGNTSGGTITVGAASGSDLVLQDANWGVTGAGAGSFASVTSTGAVAVNSASGITSNQATLIINAGGALDVQDALTADSLTSDAGVSIASGNSYTGAGAVTLSSGGATELSLDTGGAAAIKIGSTTNATSVSICNSANCDTINIGNVATDDADTINIGAALDDVVITDANWSITGAGAASFTNLTAAGTVNINQTGTGNTTIGNTAGGTITIGGASGSDLALNDAQWSVTGLGAAAFSSVSEGGTGLSSKYAPIGADYITVAANGTLTGETAIGALTAAISTTSTLNVDSSATMNAITMDAGANFAMNDGVGTFAQTYSPLGTTGAANGMTITPKFTLDATDQTLSALYINPNTNSNNDSGDTLYGLNINTITASTAVESAIRIGANWDNALDLNGTLITLTELGIVDGGIALSELSDSGTLTAGTVDLNGGNIDGVTIGASTAGAGTFTTLTATGDVTMNDATADNILIGQSGTTDDTVTIAGALSLTDDQWSISDAGAASLTGVTSTGAVAVNSASGITSNQATLIINAGGTLDVQDALTADSLTSDAGVSIANGSSYTGAGTVTLSSGGSSALTLDSASNTLIIAATDTTISATGATTLTLGANSVINPTSTGTIGLGTATATGVTIGNTGSTTNVTLTKGASGNIVLTGFNCTGYTNGGVLTTDASGNIVCANDDGGAGGSQTPWSSDIDADNFSLLDFGPNLTSRAATTIGSADNGSGASGLVTLTTGTGTTATGGLTLVTGNASAGTAGNVSIDVGTSTSSNGSIFIGNAARAQTITIGNTSGGTITVGAASGSDLVLQDANWGVTGAGAASFVGVTSTGAVAVNSASGITSNQATLIINAGGALDVQDALTADSLTSDAGVSIAASNSYTGAGAVTLTSANANSLTVQPGTTGQLIISTANTSASAMDINATGTVAGNAITMDTTDGGIAITAAGASNGDITVLATDDMSLNGTAGSVLGIGTSNVTQTVNIGLATNVDVSITDPNWSITGAGAASFTGVTSTGAIAANSASGITSTQASLVINAGGTVDIQDALTVDSITVDTAALAVNNASGITSNQATLIINAGGTLDVQDALTADTVTANANSGTAFTVTGTSFTTDIAFQNGETLDNDTDSQFNFKINTDATVTILGSDGTNANTPLTISSAGTGTLTLQPTGTGQVVLTSSNASASAVDINATGTVAGAAITLDTTDGGITLTAQGASNGDITLLSTDDTSINGTAGSVVGIGTSNVTQTVNIGLATNVDVSITDPNWSITGAGAGSFVGVTSTGAVAVNSASGITSNQATLIINAGGTLDVQDALTADSLTLDTGSLLIPAAQRLDVASAGAFNLGTTTANAINIGNTTVTAITLDVSTTGNFILRKNGAAFDCSGYGNAGALSTNSSGQVICTDDDGGTGGTGTLAQSYAADADGSDVTITLSSTDGSLIFTNPSSSGSASGYVLNITQQTVSSGGDSLRLSNSSTTAGDNELEFSDTAASVGIADAGTLNFVEAGGNYTIASLKEYYSGANYGVFEANGFINIDGSFMTDNFNNVQNNVATTDASNMSLRFGDKYSWALDHLGTYAPTVITNAAASYYCNIKQTNTYTSNLSVNGILEVSPVTTSSTAGAANNHGGAGCRIHMGSNAAGVNGLLNVANKWIMYWKVKPSSNWTNLKSARVFYFGANNYTLPWVGTIPYGTNANQGGIMMFNGDPTNNNPGSVWKGIVNQGTLANQSAVNCGVTVGTNWALLRIEGRSSSEVRFFVDDNLADNSGVPNMTDCGAASSNIPTFNIGPSANFGANLSTAQTGAGLWTVYIDLFAYVQDDPKGGIAESMASSEENSVEEEMAQPVYNPISGADLAENYVVLGERDYGDIVVHGDLVGEAQRSSVEHDRNIIGVVSESPSMVMGEYFENSLPVALNGRVLTKVSNKNGEIKKGDPITSSNLPGVGMKATIAGKIVGTAMESFDCSDNEENEGICTGKILVNVNPGYYIGDINDTALLKQTPEVVLGASEISTDSAELVATDGAELTSLAEKTIELLVDKVINFARDVRFIGSVIFKGPTEFAGKVKFSELAEFVKDVIYTGKVSFLGQVEFNKDTAGYAMIKKGERFVNVNFENEYLVDPIVNASPILPKVTFEKYNQYVEEGICNPDDGLEKCQDTVATKLLGSEIKFLITGKNKQGFMIVLNKETTMDINFSWNAIAVRDAKTYTSSSSNAEVPITPTPTVAGVSSEPTQTPTPTISVEPTVVPTETIEPTQTPTSTPTETPVVDNTLTVLVNELGYIRLRELPSVDSNEVAQIPTATTLNYMEVDNGWYKVEYNGFVGWVSGTFVQVN